MRLILSTLAFIVYICFTLQTTFAQNLERDKVELSISFESHPSEALPMFVFIKGQLSGVVPGILVMSSQESVPVEIGVAQLKRSPLYSFKFGPEVLKERKVGVVTTDIAPRVDSKANFIILNKDTVKTVELKWLGNNLYSIKLPSTAYLEVEKFKDYNRKFRELPTKNAQDYGLSSHVVYDKNERKTVFMGDSGKWSGTNMVNLIEGGGMGYNVRKLKWTLRSIPEGADIYVNTQPSSAGKTDATVEIVDSVDSYAILDMSGYQECVIRPYSGYQQCTDKDCSSSEGIDGSETFTCNLRKVP